MVITWFACLAGCDIIITSSQVFYLHNHRSGIAKSNKVVNTLILYLTTTAFVARFAVHFSTVISHYITSYLGAAFSSSFSYHWYIYISFLQIFL